jgi:hypothetical protein
VKRVTSLIVAVAFIAGIVGVGSAQTTTTTPPAQPAEKKMDKAAEKKTEKKMVSKTATGTVKSASADSVVVSGKEKGKDAEWTFAVDSKTKIKKGGKDASPADLKAGDSVSVRYMEHEGKTVAQAVNVKGGTVAKKDDTKPAEKK